MNNNKYITVTPNDMVSLETISHNFDLKGRKDDLTDARYIDKAIISLRHITSGTVKPNVHAIFIHFSSKVKFTENNKTEIMAGSVAGFQKLILTINEEESIELKNDPFTWNSEDENEKEAVESTDFIVSKEVLEKMCLADSISMRLVGMFGEWDIRNPQTFPFQFLAKVLWDTFYKDSLYTDEIKKQMSIDAEKEIVRSKGTWVYRICFGISFITLILLLSRDDSKPVGSPLVYWIFILVPIVVAGTLYIVQDKKANRIPNTWDKTP